MAAPAAAPSPSLARPAPTAAVANGAMVVVMVVYGLGAPIMKLISAPPVVAAAMRLWLAVPLLWVLSAVVGAMPTRATLRRTVLGGLLFGANLLAVFTALQRVSVAIVSVILALQPGIVLLVGARWLGERATRWHVIWTVVGIAGAALVVGGGDPQLRGDGLGLVLAVGTLLTYTGYYLLNRHHRAVSAIGAIEWITGVTLFAALFVLPIVLVQASPSDLAQIGGRDWAYLAIAVCGQGMLGHTLMAWVHRFVAAGRSSLFMLGMNVVAVSAAWPIHGEAVTVLQAMGGAVVLGAVAAVISRPSSVAVTSALAGGDVGPETRPRRA